MTYRLPEIYDDSRIEFRRGGSPEARIIRLQVSFAHINRRG